MYQSIIRPLLFKFSPETAHWITFQMLKLLQSTPGALDLFSFLNGKHDDPVELMGLRFKNKVGVAAGLDKNAELLHVWKGLGFGFAEIGTVTPVKQTGNPLPRLYRLPEDKALINRMGFNNQGAQAVVQQLLKRPAGYMVGGNIGKNTNTKNEHAVGDYLKVFRAIYNHVDYVVINVSCPNITNLSKLQDKVELNKILSAIRAERSIYKVYKPLLLKISPDLNDSQLSDTLQLVVDNDINGIIATNTSISRDKLRTNADRIEFIGNGGLSGAPISARSTQVISFVRKHMSNGFPIIASGGIVDVDNAKEKLDVGADMLQLYTGFIYGGIGLIKDCLHL